MAGVSQHTWDLETEVPTVLTRATVADGKYIQKDTIDPLINRDEALKSWLEDTGNELVRVSGEMLDTISSVSSTLDTKIDTTSASLHEELTAASASLDTKIDTTSANLHNELTAASADLYNQTTAVSSSLYTSLTSTSSTLNTKIDTASGNIMSAMKTSADNLILYTNSASAYVQGNLQTSADALVSALNDLDTEFNEYLSALSANVSSNYVQKGGSQSVGQIAVWESTANGLKVSGRNIETQATNITVDGGSSTSIPTVGAVAGAIDNKVAGLFKFKGSETVAKINGLSTPSEGDVYNVSDNGTITYGEKSNMPVSAGDNIVWVKPTGSNGYWDKMAAAFDDSNCMKKVSPVTANDIATFGSDGQVNDSGKSVITTAPVNTSTDNTLPTSFAVYKAISGFASKVAAGDAGEILVASTTGDLSGSNVTITTTKPETGSTNATVPTSLAVSGAIYDATTGKLDKFNNAAAGNVVVVNPDGTNLSASNYTLGASIPTPVAANKVLKTNDSNVPTWVDETTFTPVLNSKTASGYVAAGDTYNNLGGAWVVDDGFYHEDSQWYTDGPDIGKPKWGRIGKIKKITIRGGTALDPTDITDICHGRSFIYCLGPNSNVNDKSYVKIVLSPELDDDEIQLHFPNKDGGTLTIENKYGEDGYIKARGASIPIADNGTYTIDFTANALVTVGRFGSAIMICEGGAGSTNKTKIKTINFTVPVNVGPGDDTFDTELTNALSNDSTIINDLSSDDCEVILCERRQVTSNPVRIAITRFVQTNNTGTYEQGTEQQYTFVEANSASGTEAKITVTVTMPPRGSATITATSVKNNTGGHLPSKPSDMSSTSKYTIVNNGWVKIGKGLVFEVNSGNLCAENRVPSSGAVTIQGSGYQYDICQLPGPFYYLGYNYGNYNELRLTLRYTASGSSDARFVGKMFVGTTVKDVSFNKTISSARDCITISEADLQTKSNILIEGLLNGTCHLTITVFYENDTYKLQAAAWTTQTVPVS